MGGGGKKVWSESEKYSKWHETSRNAAESNDKEWHPQSHLATADISSCSLTTDNQCHICNLSVVRQRPSEPGSAWWEEDGGSEQRECDVIIARRFRDQGARCLHEPPGYKSSCSFGILEVGALYSEKLPWIRRGFNLTLTLNTHCCWKVYWVGIISWCTFPSVGHWGQENLFLATKETRPWDATPQWQSLLLSIFFASWLFFVFLPHI